MSETNDSAVTEPIRPAEPVAEPAAAAVEPPVVPAPAAPGSPMPAAPAAPPASAAPKHRTAVIVGGVAVAAALAVGIFGSGVAVGSHFGGGRFGDRDGFAGGQVAAGVQGQATQPQMGQGRGGWNDQQGQVPQQGMRGGRGFGRGGFPGSGAPTATPTQ